MQESVLLVVSGNLTLSQRAVAENLVKNFGVITRSKATPHNCLMLAALDGDELIDATPFRSLIGHLMRLANQTKVPEIVPPILGCLEKKRGKTKIWGCQNMR